jgi:DNA-binding MarR family transcriptional regulator
MLKPNASLSIAEKKLFQFIRLFAQKYEYQPSRKEMADYFETSKETITMQLGSMEKKGWIKRIDSRAILLFDDKRS